MSDLFRFAGDIEFSEDTPAPGQISAVRLKQYSETCNFLQYQRPLSREHPYFFAQIKSLAPNSVITIGIAGPDIADEVHPGKWINTVGYQSNTGRCYTSHKLGANTDGQRFSVGDLFGVLVTYFGTDMSTVMFLKNGQPVATRYHFEREHDEFLPTIALENGPIDLGLMWPEAAIGIPNYSEKNMLHWIRSPLVQYDRTENVFYYNDLLRDELPVQSPFPLSKDIQHFEVIIKEVSDDGATNCIAIATCSPIKPTPTCELLRDYFRWHPDGQALKMKIGQRMGWGILYDPDRRDEPDFSDKDSQLVLCYVSIDSVIVFHKMMLQPPGGWYPLVLLHPYASKVQIDMVRNTRPKVFDKLDDLYRQSVHESMQQIQEDTLATQIKLSMLRKSDALQVNVDKIFCNIKLSGDNVGIHTIQFLEPLTPETSYFYVEVKKASEGSVIVVGIAPLDFPLNKYPGRSKGTVGYQSRDGKMFYSDRCEANTVGHRFGQGDCVGLELEVFDHPRSIALFSKNFVPVGTRYVNQKDHSLFLPTISIFGDNNDVELNVVWQSRISAPPTFQVTNVEHWCVPEGARVDAETNMVTVESGHTSAEVIQAPYSLHRSYNHFEIRIIDDFDENIPPPAIALGTASPIYKDGMSNFRQDFIRFWAIDDAMSAIKKGDLVGWGILYPDDDMYEESSHLVICYLTINRDVALTRVLFNPPGGFYPLVVLPYGVDRVQLEFGATVISEHPFTKQAVESLIGEALTMLKDEKKRVAEGKDLEEWTKKENKGKYLRPVPDPVIESASDIEVTQQEDLIRRFPVEENLVKEATRNSRHTEVKMPGSGKSHRRNKSRSEESTNFGNQKNSKSCTVL
ncbi:uncharacterized protein LOC135487894 isoform X2 [Lineus longissimus]|uniref:uncharacterized protein LOC135487894 isoform X2 n=1 Tax=Lineus longissimus TaxID=88925 RepID=UPI00315DE9DB